MKRSLFLILILIQATTWAKTPIKVLLTFDDGPATSKSSKLYSWSPTTKILNTLDKEGIKASFFVLTGPDKWLFNKFKKAESKEGFEILVDTISRGHHIACHWGGNYKSQLLLHPIRMKDPAYDFNGDGVIDKVSQVGNALETDLLQCLDLTKNAFRIAKSDQLIRHIRPPLWKFKKDGLDSRSVYKKLGLKMIMSDTKLYDGGYWTAGIQRISKMSSELKAVIKSGKKDIIITMHDSNHRTAKKLKKHIRKIEKVFKQLGLERGKEWDFTSSLDEVEDLLDRY